MLRYTILLWRQLHTPCHDNGVARVLKKLRTSKGDYCLKQRFSTITSLFKMGTSLKEKDLLPETPSMNIHEGKGEAQVTQAKWV